MKWLNRLILKKALNKLINYLKKLGMNNDKKLTITGVIGGLGIILTQVYYALDADPATTLSFEAIIAAFALMGLGWFGKGTEDKSATKK